MKGIILAGGSGTRLHPITKVISKQLLPIHDKPMIYYPLSVLMLAGINEVLIISTPHDLPNFIKLFGNGEDIGIKISYEEQPSPDGLAQAFIIGEKFIGNDDVCLILGDNLFYGDGLSSLLKNSVKKVKAEKKPVIFAHYVIDPERYGVVNFDENFVAKNIEEKPLIPKSNYAVVGLYFYTNDVVQIAKNIKPSKRGELEISSINQAFLEKGDLNVNIMGRGYTWLDTGTHESLLEASNYIQLIEKRQGLKVACLEEIAFQNNFISKKQLINLANKYKNDNYRDYLIQRSSEI